MVKAKDGQKKQKVHDFLDKKDFDEIKKSMSEFDKKREEIIKASRDVLKDSKQAIYSIHRSDIRNAESLLRSAEKNIAAIKKEIIRIPKLDTVGAFSCAMQEYIEAKTYLSFVRKGNIPASKNFRADKEDYLLGLCDLTGELGRRAVHSVINGDIDEVYKVRDAISQIYGSFLELDPRNGELRKKSDSIKWNLKKVEDIIYDIKTRGMQQ